MIQALWSDLRYGARMLVKNPGFTLAAMITLVLGIGGNTAVFTVMNALLLRALPYDHPQQLVLLNTQRRSDNNQSGGFTLNRYELVRDRNHSFSGVAVFANDSFNLTGRGEPQQVPVARVSPNFFSVLGVSAQMGRTFSDDEGQPAGKPVIMISDSLWHTRFGGDPSIVGQSVTLDSAPYTIIGVLPSGVQYPFVGPAEVWSPRYFELTFLPTEHLRAGTGYLTGVARLRPESSITTATAEMEVLHKQYSQEYPKAPDSGADIAMVVGNLQELTVANIRTRLLMLSGAVGLVLIIGCANVASLLLSRALARKREIAIRAALGAPRAVLIRQLLTESVLLSLVSGGLGLLLGFWGTRTLVQLAQRSLPSGFDITMDWHVLLFTLGVSLFTGLLFGMFPAMQLSRTNVNAELRDEGRGTTGGHRRVQLKNLLVIFQVTLSMVLLIFAALLLKSFSRLQNVELGFDPQNVLSMNVSLPTVKYAGKDQQIAFFDEVLRKVSVLPGVKSAAVSAALPITPRRITPVLPEGQPEVPLAQRPFIIIEAISPAWFQTLRVPIIMGRTFAESDNAQAPKVIIINEALAHRYWPSQNPVGKHIVVGRQPTAEIVGVAAAVKNNGLVLDSQPQIYLPFPQLPWGNMNLLVRTTTDPHQLVSSVQQQIYSIDRDQPITNVQTVDELLSTSRSQPRLMMFMLGVFSVVGLVLVVVGIYGVIAYSVEQRRPELGIRLALGADRSDILRLVVGQGLIITLIGIGIGLVTALVLTRLMSTVFYKVSAWDLSTFTFSSMLFLAIAVFASYLPARRAAKVHPTEALRQE